VINASAMTHKRHEAKGKAQDISGAMWGAGVSGVTSVRKKADGSNACATEATHVAAGGGGGGGGDRVRERVAREIRGQDRPSLLTDGDAGRAALMLGEGGNLPAHRRLRLRRRPGRRRRGGGVYRHFRRVDFIRAREKRATSAAAAAAAEASVCGNPLCTPPRRPRRTRRDRAKTLSASSRRRRCRRASAA